MTIWQNNQNTKNRTLVELCQHKQRVRESFKLIKPMFCCFLKYYQWRLTEWVCVASNCSIRMRIACSCSFNINICSLRIALERQQSCRLAHSLIAVRYRSELNSSVLIFTLTPPFQQKINFNITYTYVQSAYKFITGLFLLFLICLFLSIFIYFEKDLTVSSCTAVVVSRRESSVVVDSEVFEWPV